MLWLLQTMVCTCFYLVGVYILSGNPKHSVIDTNHGIDQVRFVCVYILSGNPDHAVIHANYGIYLFYLV